MWQWSMPSDAEGVELRPEWMRWLRAQDGAVKGIQRALVFHLVLVGYEDRPQEVHGFVVDPKLHHLPFTLAERRARAVGKELNLPVAVRWDRVFDDVPCEMRERGQRRRPLAYPQQMKDWRRWVSWRLAPG